MATAETIARALGGRKVGGGWMARCAKIMTATAENGAHDRPAFAR
jgi:hypothetical protein